MRIAGPFASLLIATLVCVTSSAGEAPPRTRTVLIADVSAKALNAVVARSVDRLEPASDVIQDMPVHGMSRTLGNVGIMLTPNHSHALVDVHFEGCVYSRTVGTRQTLLVETLTATPLKVHQHVVVDGQGIRIHQGPAIGSSNIELLDFRSQMNMDRLTLRLARRIYEQRRPAAEAESTAKTLGRVSSGMTRELTPTLALASKFVGRELKELKRAGLPIDGLAFNTTAKFMQAQLRMTPTDAAQPKPAPALPQGADLGLRIHESLANEAFRVQLAGRAFRLEDTAELYDEVTRGFVQDGRKGSDPNALKRIGKDLAVLAGKPVTMRFTQEKPMTILIKQNELEIEVRLASIEQNGVKYAGQSLKSTYTFDNDKKAAQAIRKGPVRVLPIVVAKDDKMAPLPLEFQVAQTLLFSEVFKERLALADVPMPDALAGLTLSAPHAASLNGWLTITWKLR